MFEAMTGVAWPNTRPVLRTYADYQKYNFFCVPEWRFNRVLEIVDGEGSGGRCSKRDDRYVRTARAFVQRWRDYPEKEARDRLLWDFPGLYYAYEFRERITEDHEAAMYIEARLLTNQTSAQIGDAMGILPEAVDWYAALFFDVRGRLKHRDWITKQVLLPAVVRNPVPAPGATAGDYLRRDPTVTKPFLDGTLKMFAYFGGPHVVDVMITGFESGKLLSGPDDLANWFDKVWATSIRRRSAQAACLFEVNKYNVMELFATHTKIIEIERSEESAEQSRTTYEKHIAALLNEIPWAVGDDGRAMYAGSIVGAQDDMAAELRDDEVVRISAGQPTPTLIIDDLPKALPAPRRDKKSMLAAKETEI